MCGARARRAQILLDLRTILASLRTRHRSLEDNVLEAFFEVIECCIEASKTASELKLINDSEYDVTAIWILPFVFERLVLEK